MKYLFKKIEPKWQAKWEESKVFEAKDNSYIVDTSTFIISPSFNTLSGLGIPWHISSFIDVHTLLGKS